MLKSCRQCGKQFDAKEAFHQFCTPGCKEQSQRSPGQRSAVQSSGRPPAPASVPAECMFTSFYENGHLRRAIYLEAAQKMADLCMREYLTTSQLRQLFFMLKSVEQRLKGEPELDFGIVQEAVWKFARQVEYQVKRGVMKSPTFAAFIAKHVDVACKDVKEFRGFVEYLTSIVAYLKEK